MFLTPSNIAFFSTQANAVWNSSFQAAPIFYPDIATTYPMGTSDTVTVWEDMQPKLREWIGPRQINIPAPQTYKVSVQNFEHTLTIDLFKLQDDWMGAQGQYGQSIARQAIQAAKWPDYQIRDLLQGLGSQSSTARQLGVDGVAHWSTAHPKNFWDSSAGTYANDFRGGVSVNGITVGGILTNNSYATVWNEMASRVGANGEPYGLIPDKLMIPPQLSYTAKTILNAEFFAPGTIGPSGVGALTSQVGAAQNVLKGSSDLLMWPELNAQPDEWYLLVNNWGVKPFSWFLRQAPQFTPRVSPTDPSVFDTHSLLYGVIARGTPAWGLPFLSSISGS